MLESNQPNNKSNTSTEQFEIEQKFEIQSARFLPNLPEPHPCSRMHGNTFQIYLTFKGKLNSTGWLIDFNEIHQKATEVIKPLDHKVLNDFKGLEIPTTELLAKWIYQKIKASIPELDSVSVSESSSTKCSYRLI